MSRNLRNKQLAVVVIDETDSEDGGTERNNDNDPDYKVTYQSIKGTKRSMDSMDNNVGKRNGRMELKGNVNKTEERKSSRTSAESSASHEITIDDDDEDDDIVFEECTPVKDGIRSGFDKITETEKVATVQAPSSGTKSVQNTLNKNLNNLQSDNQERFEEIMDDSDHELENRSTEMVTRQKQQDEVYVIDTVKTNSKVSNSVKDTAAGRKRKLGSKANVTREKELSASTDLVVLAENQSVIHNMETMDVELAPPVPVKNGKRKIAAEPAATKMPKIAQKTSAKKKLTANTTKSKANKDIPDGIDKQLQGEWSESEYLSEFNKIDNAIAQNIIALFKDDNTIPFIARYRKEMTGGMEPEQLRDIKNTYDNIKLIKQRASTILNSIDKSGNWSPEIHAAIKAAKSLNELEHIYAPFKPGSKRTFAERAKELGLAPVAQSILLGQAMPTLCLLVDTSRNGLKTETDVRQGIMHIIADIISKDRSTFETIRTLRKTAFMNIETTKSKIARCPKSNSDDKAKKNDEHKYENYFHFISSEPVIKDFQILAINRGEAQKILTVKIVPPDWFERELKYHCLKKYNFIRKISDFHHRILDDSFDDAYNRLIKGFVIRQVRHELNEKAERSSIEVFAKNLKTLLLTPPYQGKTILGIDPGFAHGCKLAVVSQNGNVLDTATIYPHTRPNHEAQAKVLADLIKKHNCTTIALGNATACRETEQYLTDLIQARVFAPLNVSYTIVNEAGASIYSCASEAKFEFPDMDPNLISAISIARRLQDPLAEFVKVEPKHLGVGMYQHDLPKKQLELTLTEVIMETVSFVGVDVNTASHCLLRRVAGLNANRATKIIERRTHYGPFWNRQELFEVEGIGKKTFEQCAGFIRIVPETAYDGATSSSKKYVLDALDETLIHPECYDLARQFLKACNCDLIDLGTDDMIKKVQTFANQNSDNLTHMFKTSQNTIDVIIKGLTMKKGEDIRLKQEAPLFRQNLRCIADLRENTKLSGLVMNVTNFGSFIDIGVGKNALIPRSKLKGHTLTLGQRVEVTVFSIDAARGRIVLTF